MSCRESFESDVSSGGKYSSAVDSSVGHPPMEKMVDEILYFADVSCEMAFIMPSLLPSYQRFRHMASHAESCEEDLGSVQRKRTRSGSTGSLETTSTSSGSQLDVRSKLSRKASEGIGYEVNRENQTVFYLTLCAVLTVDLPLVVFREMVALRSNFDSFLFRRTKSQAIKSFVTPKTITSCLKQFIKCSEKFARRDWSKRVHCISKKHARYVTRVHCRHIMHVAYVISTSARNSRYIYKRNKKLVPHTLLSYISTWDFLITLENCEKHSPADHASLSMIVG